VSTQATGSMVPMEVSWTPGWLTWVSATTSCLGALGVDCDQADVAGLSGYAFVLNVHTGLCPSGPTAFDWRPLTEGVFFLGRTTRDYGGPGSDLLGGYEFAAEEIAAGRPCVIWGAYIPEFAVAIGVDDGAFLVKSYREMTGEPQPPIPCEDLQAPGGPYYLGFPSERPPDRAAGDRHAIRRAVEPLRGGGPPGVYAFGLEAYDMWIATLDANEANPFGNAYNAQCYAEARRFAQEFMSRVAGRNPDLAEPIGRAAEAYGEVARALGEMAALFPFPHGGQVGEEAVRAKAVGHLRVAKTAEAKAAEALAEAENI